MFCNYAHLTPKRKLLLARIYLTKARAALKPENRNKWLRFAYVHSIDLVCRDSYSPELNSKIAQLQSELLEENFKDRARQD